jgi:hypothetical protein
VPEQFEDFKSTFLIISEIEIKVNPCYLSLFFTNTKKANGKTIQVNLHSGAEK